MPTEIPLWVTIAISGACGAVSAAFINGAMNGIVAAYKAKFDDSHMKSSMIYKVKMDIVTQFFAAVNKGFEEAGYCVEHVNDTSKEELLKRLKVAQDNIYAAIALTPIYFLPTTSGNFRGAASIPIGVIGMAMGVVESAGMEGPKEYILTQARRTFEPDAKLIESLKYDLLPVSHIKMQRADSQRFIKWLHKDLGWLKFRQLQKEARRRRDVY